MPASLPTCLALNARNSCLTTGSASRLSSQQSFLCGIILGAGPACKHEANLVDEICNVVDHIQVDLIHGPHQVAEKVAQGVDAPARRDDDAHVVERSCNGLAAVFCGANCLAC